MFSLKDNVKETYHSIYETDELWEELKDEPTFEYVLNEMQKGEDFYEIVGDIDSIVRERIFSLLENILQNMGYKVQYDDIYYLWLNKTPIRLEKDE